jgi:hypothetical protein
MSEDADDIVLHRIRSLGGFDSDPVRAVRVRARCHEILARRQQRPEFQKRPDRFTDLLLQPLFVVCLSLGYLAAVIYDVIR